MKRWQCPSCADVVLAPRAPATVDVRRYCLDCSKSTGKLVSRFCVTAKQRAHEKRAAELAERKAAAAVKKAERSAAIRPDIVATSPAGLYLDLIRLSSLDITTLLDEDDGAARKLVALAIRSMCTRSPRLEQVVKFQREVTRGLSQAFTPYGIRKASAHVGWVPGTNGRQTFEHTYYCLFCDADVHTVGHGGALLQENWEKLLRHGSACAMEYLIKLDQLTTPGPEAT